MDPTDPASRIVVPFGSEEYGGANAAIGSLLAMCARVAHDGLATTVAGVVYCDFRPARADAHDMRYVHLRDLATLDLIGVPQQLMERLMPDAEKAFPKTLFYPVRATDARYDVYAGETA